VDKSSFAADIQFYKLKQSESGKSGKEIEFVPAKFIKLTYEEFSARA